jgi:MFS family permease
MSQLKVVLSQPVFLLLSVGYGAFFFAFGGFAYWTPTVMEALYPEDASMAPLGFGGVTILTGVIGTAAGGILMDWLSTRLKSRKQLLGFPDETIRVLAGVAICVVLCLLGMLFTFPTTFSPNIFIFLIFFAMGTLLLFSMTAPINIAIMYSVPPALKAQAMAVSTGLSHLIGDFPSPFAIGAIMDAAGMKTAMLATSAILLVPSALWFGAGYVAKRDAVVEEPKPEPTTA